MNLDIKYVCTKVLSHSDNADIGKIKTLSEWVDYLFSEYDKEVRTAFLKQHTRNIDVLVYIRAKTGRRLDTVNAY